MPKPKRTRKQARAERAPSARRMDIRDHAWLTLQTQLRVHLQACKDFGLKHEQAHIARTLGVSDSVVHRWADLCGCDHNSEPPFSLGFALFLYLNDPTNSPRIRIPVHTYAHNHPACYPIAKTKPQ